MHEKLERARHAGAEARTWPMARCALA
jgi:hypothetical protein